MGTRGEIIPPPILSLASSLSRASFKRMPPSSLTPPRWPTWLRATFGSQWFLPAALSVLVLWYGAGVIAVSRDAERTREFFESGDGTHYREISEEFAAGDFSLGFVEKRAQRVPLYPLALSPASKLAPRSVLSLGFTNVLIGVAGLTALYFCIRRLFGDPVTAGLASVFFLASQFIRKEISTRLMTEPLFIVWVILVIFAFLAYARRPSIPPLLAFAASCGLAYLTRPNGLFIFLSGLGTLGLADLVRMWAAIRRENGHILPLLAGLASRHLAAVVVFLALTAPNWVPRVHFHGNPIYHANLSNYMWAHTYEVAKNHDNHVTFQDYLDTATPQMFAARWANGIHQTWWDMHANTGEKAALYFIAMAGLVLAALRGPPEFRWLFLFMLLALLPVTWAYEANPNRRMIYGPMVCFLFFFAARAINALGWRLQGRQPAHPLP